MTITLGLQEKLRTFLCPACGGVAMEGRPECPNCGLRVDPLVAADAAARRERFLKAFSDAHSLAITARTLPMLLFAVRSFILGPVGLVGGAVLLALIPLGLLRWFWRYRGLPQDQDSAQVRRWLWESAGIWLLCALGVAAFSWIVATGVSSQAP